MPILALTDPTYQPAMRIISAMTNSDPMTITTTFAHDYITGIIVRLVIPPGYGMLQADDRIGTITVTAPTIFTIDIDTTFYDAFTVPVTFPENKQEAQVVPIGEESELLTAATKNVSS